MIVLCRNHRRVNIFCQLITKLQLTFLYSCTNPPAMKILYVDDDSEDREIFIEILEVIDPEIKVVEASNGIETINILASEDLPDIIFLDINMPLLNGDQTLVEIRKDERLNNTKVVMYSTNVSKTSIPKYQTLNAQYINKPYTVQDGIRILKHVIKEQTPNRAY